MNDIRQINRLFCYIPSLPLICWLTVVVIGSYTFGRLPLYGLDPEPYSLSIEWLDSIAFFLILVCFFTIPATLFMTMYLLIERVALSRQDKIALIIFSISVSTIIAFRMYLTRTFEWVVD